MTAPDRVVSGAETLMRPKRPDLLWVTFVAVHLAGHRFWDRPAVLEEIVEAADAALGRLVALLPDDAAIVVFSPKAMGPSTSRVDLLPEMLARVVEGRRDSGRRPYRQSSLSRLRAVLPTELRESMAAMVPDRVALALTARLETFRMDWRKTYAFTLPSDGAGFVRLNLKGRERHGIVDPREKDRLLDEIAAGLSTFDDIGGGPAVRGVVRPGEILEPGPRIDLLPDLVVLWSEAPTVTLRGVTSPTFGEVLRTGSGIGRSGEHVGDAWAVVLSGGRGFAPGEWGTVRAVDLSATVCSVLGSTNDVRAGRPLLQ